MTSAHRPAGLFAGAGAGAVTSCHFHDIQTGWRRHPEVKTVPQRENQPTHFCLVYLWVKAAERQMSAEARRRKKRPRDKQTNIAPAS